MVLACSLTEFTNLILLSNVACPVTLLKMQYLNRVCVQVKKIAKYVLVAS